ncbi:hypothetical protein D3C78_1947240 [compost metagenome]
MLMNIDTRQASSAPFAGSVAERIRQIADAHAALPLPAYVGRMIALPVRAQG